MKKIATILAAMAVALVIGFAVSIPAYAGGPSSEETFNTMLNNGIETSLSNRLVTSERRVIKDKKRISGWKKDAEIYCVLGYLDNATLRMTADGPIPEMLPAGSSFKKGDAVKGFRVAFLARIDIWGSSSWVKTKPRHYSNKKYFDIVMDQMQKEYQACLTGN
jgi:hypothetical protein